MTVKIKITFIVTPKCKNCSLYKKDDDECGLSFKAKTPIDVWSGCEHFETNDFNKENLVETEIYND